VILDNGTTVTAQTYVDIDATTGQVQYSMVRRRYGNNASQLPVDAGTNILVEQFALLQAYADVELRAGGNLSVDSHDFGVATVQADNGDVLLRAGDDIFIAPTGCHRRSTTTTPATTP